MTDTRTTSSLVAQESLQGFFYECLIDANEKSMCPLPHFLIHYTSSVLEKYCLSSDFFRMEDGRVRPPYLGIELLESYQSSDQQTEVQKVGDQALVYTGYFSTAINRQLIGRSYYIKVGKSAYERLNAYRPEVFDIPAFFGKLASSFEVLSGLIKRVALDLSPDQLSEFVLSSDLSEEDIVITGSSDFNQKKIV